ncbi:MAG TPA: hypothetical protein VK028_02780, partial [Micromonosporaceae bacterium]|nr:hypothetical protein [Micromonosporaceae bacterium]
GQPPAPAVTSLPISLPTGEHPQHHPAGAAAGQHAYLGQPATGYGRAGLGQPGPAGLPGQRGPSPMEVPRDDTMVLPRRSPDEGIPSLSGPSALTPDPEAVRARLSSLAHGIAAAQHGHAAPPPPPTPQSR